MTEQELICIGCPSGCHVILQVTEKGVIEGIAGNECKEGKEYVVAEFLDPIRVFTATIRTEEGTRLLPVRTDKPVHRKHLMDFMRALAPMRISCPVAKGEVIIHNLRGTGANLVVTAPLS